MGRHLRHLRVTVCVCVYTLRNSFLAHLITFLSFRSTARQVTLLTVMTEGGVQVYFQLVFVEELIVPRRVTAGTGALHTAKVLRPPCPTGVLLQPLLFRPSTGQEIATT